MSLFGFISPFTMQAHFTSASSYDDGTASSLSSPSTSSQSSYTSTESHLQPPIDSSVVSGPCSDDDLHFFPARSPSPPPASSFDSYAAPPPAVAPLPPVDVAPAPAPTPAPAPVAPQTSFAQAQAAMAAQNSSHSQNLIGQVIDNSSPHTGVSHLEFVSVLGLGAYGVVYLARDIAARPSLYPTSRAHPELGNLPLYAVKCLNKVGLDVRQRSFQQREINLHYAASQHPNVATLYNVIDDETCTYVVLEFCDEGDLFGMITDRQRYLSDDDLIRRVFLQIVDAVEYCHANGIYRRDLKPENILCLDDGEKVMLADFGLATGERMSGDFGCGSTFYMSPECQGGLFQRLSSYSTPHNDIWSLGVILVNLTCGRNPWKQACPSDETFCAYLGNPDFLRSILPISEHTNRILKRIFALNPQARISLADLRREILSVDTFVMSENELRHATRATKEAARAFAASAAKAPREVEPEVEHVVARPHPHADEAMYDDVLVEGPAEHERFESTPQTTPWQKAEGFSSPATPTQPVRKTPLTPPATPRRVPRAPPTPIHPVPHSPTPRRKRVEAPSTPPPQARATFEAYRSTSADGEDLVATPPSPITPSTRRRTSPRRSPRTAARQLPNSRRRKTSIDSSSSSSGNSSQPATPTGLPPNVYSGAPTAVPYANKVRIAGEDEPVPVPALTELSLDQPCTSTSSTSSTLSAGTKAAYTAYYPIWSDDWADACRDQQASYHVELPPPVVLPAEMDAHDEETEDYQFPVPPSAGYYTRVPAPASREEQLAH
ncbi:kinase-like domain-containing protein [Rhodotorula diobovata]|uniref:non-specific serine/threonine protein kinase n=1 Tax=Rhodotorula diobovata TaxID=5288 RepID=A0A5C5FPY9_9BASI|nr:kinase-like domain-containing protein [Rhodotorula diobovata]